MITIKKYNLENKYNKRIILISDIHYYSKKIIPSLNKLLEEIKKLKPDYICVVGDIVDDINIKDQDHLVEWFKKLRKICKVFISFGNHDFYYNHKLVEDYAKEVFDKLKNINNIYILDNKIHSEYGINFIGLTLPYDYYDLNESEEQLIYFINKKIPFLSKGYNIILCHSPIHFSNEEVLNSLKCRKSINLVLSGHMHAGLTFEWLKKILKGRGIFSPQGSFFKKYCYGIYNFDELKLIITSGVTKISKSHFMRIFNHLYKSEICVIDI